jgi:hypothetical protein
VTHNVGPYVILRKGPDSSGPQKRALIAGLQPLRVAPASCRLGKEPPGRRRYCFPPAEGGSTLPHSEAAFATRNANYDAFGPIINTADDDITAAPINSELKPPECNNDVTP